MYEQVFSQIAVVRIEANVWQAVVEADQTIDAPRRYSWSATFLDQETAHSAARCQHDYLVPPGFDRLTHINGITPSLAHNLLDRRGPLMHAGVMRKMFGTIGVERYV